MGRKKQRGNSGIPRRKPRGTTGALHIAVDRPLEFLPNNLPDEKAQIEAVVLNAALESARSQGLTLYELIAEPIQNAENDFDFTLPTSAGNEFVDLVEFVYLGGYSKAPTKYNVGQFAERIFDQIRIKSRKYGFGRGATIHLLVYTTHWKFMPSESVISLVSNFCATRNHGFKTVAIAAPLMSEKYMLWKCYPVEDTVLISSSQERLLRAQTFYQFDPQAAREPEGAAGALWEMPTE